MIDSTEILNGNFYTRKETAEKLHVSAITIDNYIKRKKLKAIKVGGKVLISETALKEFIENSQEK